MFRTLQYLGYDGTGPEEMQRCIAQDRAKLQVTTNSLKIYRRNTL
jgi:hypothetical protein